MLLCFYMFSVIRLHVWMVWSQVDSCRVNVREDLYMKLPKSHVFSLVFEFSDGEIVWTGVMQRQWVFSFVFSCVKTKKLRKYDKNLKEWRLYLITICENILNVIYSYICIYFSLYFRLFVLNQIDKIKFYPPDC